MLTRARILVSLLLMVFLASCAAAPASPTPAGTAAAAPTLTPTPTEGIMPTPTLSPAPACASLMTAVKKQDAALVRTCLQQGQDPNQADPDGLSALNYAASLGDVDIVKALLEAGSDVNYQDPWGMTSLHAALKEGHEEITLLLLEHGADVNVQTTGGYYIGFSPLHTAVYFGKTGSETVEELLKQGADVNAVDHAGRTALQMASEKGLAEIAALLTRYGAKN